MTARRLSGGATLVVTLLLLVATPAAAEVHATAAATSDARFRGRSVSQGRPVASLDLSYDAPDGYYLGAQGAAVAVPGRGPRLLTLQTYAGRVRRLASGTALDLGVTQVRYTGYYGRRGGVDYGEAYAGLARGRFAARLAYSPNYFGLNAPTLHAEVAGAIHPAPELRLSGGIGVLTYLGRPRIRALRRTQYDARLGAAASLGGSELEIVWSGAAPDGLRRSGVAVSLTHSF